MANVYKGKSAEEWGALGKFGKARAASRGGQTGKEWKGEKTAVVDACSSTSGRSSARSTRF